MPELSWLERDIHWMRSGDVDASWTASYDGHLLRLNLGDFPAEMLYTLVVDDIEIVSVDDWPAAWKRTVVLRDEHHGHDRRSLWAYLDANGDFIIDGQDLGPSVEQAFGEGAYEYEWKRTVPAVEVPRLRALLDTSADGNVLTALEAWLTTHRPGELEMLIEEQGLTSVFWSRVGD